MDLSIDKTNFTFHVHAVWALESTIPDGRPGVGRPGFSETKTNSAQAGAGARAELGKKKNTEHWLIINIKQTASFAFLGVYKV